MSQVIEAPTERPSYTGQDFNGEVHVYNDNSFPMDRVIAAFCKVLPGMDPEKAYRMMMTIHTEGVGTVFQGPKEVCELYAEQLSGYGLDARVA